MGVHYKLFLGPYTTFPFPRGVERRLPRDDKGERLGWRSFYCCLQGESGDRAYYMPRGPWGEVPKPAPREMYFEDPELPWEPDLVEVDTRAEIDWFALEYAAELAEIEAAFGSKPVFGWGLLGWYF